MEVVLENVKKTIWKNIPFVILISTGFLLSIGNKIYELVLPLIIYEISNHSSVAVSSMRTAELLPNFLFAVFIGVIVDRLNKRKWALWMIGMQALLLFLLAYLVQTEVHLMWVYYFIGFLLMTFNYGYFNAQVSLTKLTVPSNQLTSANSKFSFIDSFVGIMGPVFTGLLFLLAHLYFGLYIAAAVYLICFILLSQLSISEEVTSNKGSLWKDLKEGWELFQSKPILWRTTIYTILLNATFIVVSTTIIFLAKDTLQLSDSQIALVFSMAGVGGLVGSICANRLREKLGIGVLFGLGALLNGLAYLRDVFFHNPSSIISFVVCTWLRFHLS